MKKGYECDYEKENIPVFLSDTVMVASVKPTPVFISDTIMVASVKPTPVFISDSHDGECKNLRSGDFNIITSNHWVQ